MAKRKQTKSELYSTRRIEALSDGIFAIAMTILVLDLGISHMSQTISSRELWQELVKISPNIYNFMVSFLILGSMWAVHMRQFEFITKSDRKLTMLNTLRLMMVVLIPFSTSITGDFSANGLGRVILPINLLLLAIVSYIQWLYAIGNPQFYQAKRPKDKTAGNQRSIAFIFVAVLVCGGAYFIGTWTYLLFLAVPLFTSKKLRE